MNYFFLILCILRFNYVLLWTDFSQTVVNNQSIFGLFGVKAYCPGNSIIRGFEIEKPTISTVRWNLQCIPLQIEGGHISHLVSDQVECLNDTSFSWMNKINLRCPPERVLYGLSLELYKDNLCGFHYLCKTIPGSLCINSNKIVTKTVPFPKDLQNEMIPHLPVVAGDYYAGLQGLMMDITNDTFNYKYSWCVLPQFNISNNYDGLIEENDLMIEMFFNLDDDKSLNYIVDVLGEVKKQFHNQIRFSFYPHYLINFKTTKNKEEECINNYCLSKKEKVIESLKQFCIYQEDKELYFLYMDEYKNNCTEYYNGCGEKIFEKYNIDKNRIEKCINETFTSEGDNNYFEPITLVIQEKNYTKFPVLLINQKQSTMKNKDEIFAQICLNSSIIDRTPCEEFDKLNEPSTFWYIIKIILYLIFFVVIIRILLIIYKKYLS